MKYLPKLLCSLFLFCTISVHAQNENVVFPYSDDLLIELLQDCNWNVINPEQAMVMMIENNQMKL